MLTLWDLASRKVTDDYFRNFCSYRDAPLSVCMLRDWLGFWLYVARLLAMVLINSSYCRRLKSLY